MRGAAAAITPYCKSQRLERCSGELQKPRDLEGGPERAEEDTRGGSREPTARGKGRPKGGVT